MLMSEQAYHIPALLPESLEALDINPAEFMSTPLSVAAVTLMPSSNTCPPMATSTALTRTMKQSDGHSPIRGLQLCTATSDSFRTG